MKHIVRKISLEQFKSRMPGMSRSYLEDDEYDFPKENIFTYPYSNYGMFPCDIVIEDVRYAYNTLVDIYHKCEERDRLLSSGTCGREYSSLTEYYDYEKENSPLSREECVERDAFYTKNDTEYGVAQQLFPRFIIPLDFRDAWGCTYLYIPDVIKWIKWFNDANTDNCCVNQEYLARGGKEMLDLLNTWLNDVQTNFNIDDYYVEYSDDELMLMDKKPTDKEGKLHKTCISVPLTITQNIDNLGDMSIMLEEWVLGKDYTSPLGQGVQVIYNDNVYEVDGKGYEYDSTKNEYKFLSTSIIDPTTTFENTTYAYNALGERIDNPNPDNMAVYYDIDTNNELGYVIIKGKFCPIENRAYIDVNSVIYPLTFIETNPYTVINGISYYGEYVNSAWTFTIDDEIYEVSSETKMVEHHHKYYLIDENTNCITIDDTPYYKIDGYVNYKSKKLLIYGVNQVNIGTEGIIELDEPVGEVVVDGKFKIVEPYEDKIFSSATISAYTESKLSSLETRADVVYDNLGNKLPGRYRIIEGEYETIKNDGWLDFIYVPKTTAHLSKDDKGFFGNQISQIKCWTEVEDEKKVFTTKEDMVGAITEWSGKTIYCEITYHMGCIMDDNYQIVENESGITYIDTFTLNQKTCSFMVDNVNQYILNYFEFEPTYIIYDGQQYNKKQKVPKSIITYSPKGDTVDTVMASPVIREEYKLGSSSLENIEKDIYIDRGATRSLDYHLKLFEVGSLEGLENYGNSWFRII